MGLFFILFVVLPAVVVHESTHNPYKETPC